MAERPPQKSDGGRPAHYVCDSCGVGDYRYGRTGEPCVYCGKGHTVDRVRYLIRRIWGCGNTPQEGKDG